MDVLKDIGFVLSHTWGEFSKRIKLLPKLFLGVVIVQIIFGGISYLLTNLWLSLGAAGFLIGFINAIVRASFYSILLTFFYRSIHYKRVDISLEDMKSSASMFSGDVYFIIFLIWIASFFLGRVIANPTIYFLLTLIFSPLPETIYLGRSHREGILSEMFNFLKENWAIWIPIALLTKFFGEFVFNRSYLLSWVHFIRVDQLVLSLLFLAVMCVLFLFRGLLFELLNGSNARKRKFMQNF